jgi:hypothetical protein
VDGAHGVSPSLTLLKQQVDKGAMVSDKALLLEVLLTGFLRSPASAREGLEWSRWR